MYAMIVHTYNAAHPHAALVLYHTQCMFSPEDMMFGFEKWNINDELVLVHRSDLQKPANDE
jgi:hypothetical protein